MPTQSRKAVLSKFPLRLMPSVRSTAEQFSQKEGVSLNQFINVAVAEKLAHLQHEEWARNRAKPTQETYDQIMHFADGLPDVPPQPGDELPAGYVPIHQRTEGGSKRKRQA
ncbi:hypothetical protein [Granulicella tundricola]|uniref:HicB family protein n=1 Tax=Granulicella tundricola (strain ATCC BAA-1859 / DSM 23138 / MP5ACTX9) TaxID=1198114 RepID=E8X350_GRATM|nr:hypothetical protein [Granulicella tundricola]ADW69274.1 hypothetical protein AciX9_2232 [Granulicella tundricola MP5ACTX9]